MRKKKLRQKFKRIIRTTVFRLTARKKNNQKAMDTCILDTGNHQKSYPNHEKKKTSTKVQKNY